MAFVLMARFDVYRNRGRHSDTTPYLLDIQSNHLEGLITRVMIPLRRRDTFPPIQLPADLTPVVMIEGIECFLDTPKLAAVPSKELDEAVTSIGHYQAEIAIAIDRLFGGY